MKKSALTVTLAGMLLATGNCLFSQSLADGLRSSQPLNGGTARFVSMGGATGALGADLTSTTINPAGLGVYKSSEFTITPSFKHGSLESSYNGLSASDTRNRMSLDNVGVVLSYSPFGNGEKGIVSFNMGFGFNRTNDFCSNSVAEGHNNVNSIMDYFTERAGGYFYNDLYDGGDKAPFRNGVAPWEVIMAWNTYLLFDTIPGSNGREFMPALAPGDGVVQKNLASTKGGSGAYDISFAANISNRLFVGASLGISDFSYTSNATYKEDALESNPELSPGNRFYYMDYDQFYEIQGVGYSFKLGALYTPIPSIRVGLAMHTPTLYSFNEQYSYSMLSNFDLGGKETNSTSKSPLGTYEYSFETPLKLIGSAAYILQSRGLLSIDVERVNYSSMKFRNGGDGDNLSDLNADAKSTFRSVFNFRVGGEFRIGDFALRGGYAFYPSPYKSGFINDKANVSQYSGGAGYRAGSFSIDMAYLHTAKKESYIFYPGANPVDTKISDGRFLLTFGFRF